MKKFLSILTLFIAIMFIIGLIKLALSPNSNYSYPFLNAKLDYLKKHPEYNLYFIGSSKINDQIDCKLIDDNMKGIKSYNLGANAGFNLENFQTLEYVLENPSFKPKYIVLELQDKINITRQNLKTERSFGAFNYENTLFASKFQKENGNYKQMALSWASFILNVFHFSKHYDERIIQDAHNRFVDETQGFSALDYSIIPRYEETELKNIIKDRLERYHADDRKHTPNKALVEKINELAEKCRKKNIKLIMLIPGPAEPDAKKLQVYQNAVRVPVISLVNPDEYPEFYLYENRWDNGHLNERGSKILSKKMVPFLEKFLEKK
ncbi:hypothetical protein ACM39_10440 [Chryseobacterium sp. FH2]|uniref:hypothetical protein n=1 Tax=Chryseobacterium sp. FH2 TaxID=1674291 RepID=UPI00065AB28A|nr:hypothetical protein [Chryseobacterium sp. FH2]KMQ68249.1 hypothetical protein ACM39_10440 [Chryseobacterium sp. FH2]